MFFVVGLSPERRQLPFGQQGVCPVCGRMARFEIWVTATRLTLFFLPLLRFGRRYFLVSSCCGASCELPPALGRAAERGECQTIDLSAQHFSGGAPQPRRCPACGFLSEPAFRFCPKCGTRL